MDACALHVVWTVIGQPLPRDPLSESYRALPPASYGEAAATRSEQAAPAGPRALSAGEVADTRAEIAELALGDHRVNVLAVLAIRVDPRVVQLVVSGASLDLRAIGRLKSRTSGMIMQRDPRGRTRIWSRGIWSRPLDAVARDAIVAALT